jgi:hypothetical protein
LKVWIKVLSQLEWRPKLKQPIIATVLFLTLRGVLNIEIHLLQGVEQVAE